MAVVLVGPAWRHRSNSSPSREILKATNSSARRLEADQLLANPAGVPVTKDAEDDDPNAKAPPPPSGPRVPPRALSGARPAKLPKVRAASAILMDADTGEVIYEKDADAERPMASTTKVMTALLFCEHVPEDTVITASKNACKIHNCSLHLKPGEQISARDLLRAMLIRSANDTCVAAAEQTAGSEQAFVALMNERAAQIGAFHTHFANPHGLTAPDHFTTARDLANIARQAVQQKRIMAVVKLLDCTINRSVLKRDCNLHNYTHFVGRYDGAEGLKSGWTTPSGHCYVGVASRKGWRLISVVLNTPEYGTDTTKLMDFGFGKYERIHVADSGLPTGDAPVKSGIRATVASCTAQDLRVVVPKGERDRLEKRVRFGVPKAPLEAGAEVGALDVFIAGQAVLSVPVVATESVHAAPRVAVVTGSRARNVLMGLGVFAVSLVSLRYGKYKRYRGRRLSSSKGTRNRGSRFTAHMRDDYRGRKS